MGIESFQEMEVKEGFIEEQRILEEQKILTKKVVAVAVKKELLLVMIPLR